MCKGIVIEAHDYNVHFSTDRTIARKQKNFWFSNMRRCVKQHISMSIDRLIDKKPSW